MGGRGLGGTLLERPPLPQEERLAEPADRAFLDVELDHDARLRLGRHVPEQPRPEHAEDELADLRLLDLARLRERADAERSLGAGRRMLDVAHAEPASERLVLTRAVAGQQEIPGEDGLVHVDRLLEEHVPLRRDLLRLPHRLVDRDLGRERALGVRRLVRRVVGPDGHQLLAGRSLAQASPQGVVEPRAGVDPDQPRRVQPVVGQLLDPLELARGTPGRRSERRRAHDEKSTPQARRSASGHRGPAGTVLVLARIEIFYCPV